jgi:NTE family protein
MLALLLAGQGLGCPMLAYRGKSAIPDRDRPLLWRVSVAACLACLVAGVHAEESPPAAAMPRADCVGLVLGGGGARGAAHIGVLEVLEREHVPICKVAGTSMGAIVGAMYAAGYSAADLNRVVSSIDWADMFSDDPPRRERPMRRKDADFRYLLNFELGYRNGRLVTPAGIVQGQKLLLLLRRLLLSTWDVEDFDRLPIPFRAVAADIGNAQPVVFGEGDLALAVRASMSVPGAIAPIRIDDRLLVDGGIVDNVPVDIAREMGATRLIVIDVGAPLGSRGEEQLGNPVAVLSRMLDILMREKTERQLAGLEAEDFLLKPELGDIGSADFHRAAEAVAAGRRAAEAVVAELRRFAASEDVYAAFARTHNQRDFDPGLIRFLRIAPGSGSSHVIEQMLADNLGKPLDMDRLDRDIGNVYGRGGYQQIGYRRVERDGEEGIEILPIDKPWGPVFGKLGFQLNDDFDGRSDYMIAAELNVTQINARGAEWRNNLWMGRVSGLTTEFYQPLDDLAHWYVMPSLISRAEQVPAYIDQDEVAEYRIRRNIARIDGGWAPLPDWRLAARLARGRDRVDLRVGNPVDFPDQASSFTSFTLIGMHDSLDDANFPTSGSRSQLDYEVYRPVLGGEVEGEVIRYTGDWALNWGKGDHKRNNLLLGLRLSSALDDANFVESQDFLGGFLNLSGHAERGLFGNQSLLGRAVFYRRIGDMEGMFPIPLYLGGSLEAGNTWHSRDEIGLDSLIHAGSVFGGIKTPLGPMFLGYGRASDGNDSVYLTFGSLLRPRP